MVKKGLEYKLQRREGKVVKRIQELRDDPKWEVKLVHVDRSANRVANRLVKVARQRPSDEPSSKFEPVEFPSPPDDSDIRKMLSEDKNNDTGHVYASYF
ncbi:hypothetical protein Fmac_003106 [Flemingia macrophylla]|uniref:RNase H type-1 domain-containing protein n=1 Tax=Flemingia macrophylla TaxID=520843 RepID=A0ABD1NLU5_9FABA